jgi:maltooligosyltrehalose trehalohydrolase
MLDLQKLGARAGAPSPAGVGAHFGILLPGIEPGDGYDLQVRVIHTRDRFAPDIPSRSFPLARVAGDPDGLWEADVHIEPGVGSFGTSGTYLYRYQLFRNEAAPGGAAANRRVVTNWFTDPFALATDEVGQLSAFSAGTPADFAWTDGAWKVPDLEHLVVYELHVEQFNDTFDGVVERIQYLQSLAVTCVELMPVTSLKLDFDWGYGPLHYFAPNGRWGGPQGLKRLVDACHAAGIAVILDVVYQHADPSFPYNRVYRDAGLPSPMIGGDGPFGPQFDFSRSFTRDYVKAANLHWLTDYHVDGFRYDEVTDLYDGPLGPAYATMAFDVYTESFNFPRFTPSGGPGEHSRVIQVAEALGKARTVLQETYTAAAWTDELLWKAEDMAQFHYVDDRFAQILDATFSGFPLTKQVQDRNGAPVDMPVAPFQYTDTHDHSHLIVFASGQFDRPFADRSVWYELQPFAIALLTSEGVPMLWEGQEFADNHNLPPSGDARVHFRRNTHWEYFYDEQGNPLVRLYRILGKLRQAHPSLRSRSSYYYYQLGMTGDGVVVYKREAKDPGEIAMVFLNFSASPRTVFLPFPEAGTYREMIDRDATLAVPDLTVASVNQVQRVEVPSHYGRIYMK